MPSDAFVWLLQVSWAHIYLSYPFVLSWILMEVMSAGAAIIASDIDPLREDMRNSVADMLVVFLNLCLIV